MYKRQTLGIVLLLGLLDNTNNLYTLLPALAKDSKLGVALPITTGHLWYLLLRIAISLALYLGWFSCL